MKIIIKLKWTTGGIKAVIRKKNFRYFSSTHVGGLAQFNGPLRPNLRRIETNRCVILNVKHSLRLIVWNIKKNNNFLLRGFPLLLPAQRPYVRYSNWAM